MSKKIVIMIDSRNRLGLKVFQNGSEYCYNFAHIYLERIISEGDHEIYKDFAHRPLRYLKKISFVIVLEKSPFGLRFKEISFSNRRSLSFILI